MIYFKILYLFFHHRSPPEAPTTKLNKIAKQKKASRKNSFTTRFFISAQKLIISF